MKSKIVSFILVCFVGITSQAAVEYSVLRINNDNVKLAQKNLKVELRYNKWRQIAAVSGFAGLLGFSAYKFLLSDAPAAAVPHPNVGSLTDADIHNFRWLLGELVNKFNVAKPALTWPYTWWEWLKQQVHSNTHLLLVGVASTVVFNFMNNSLGPISKYLNRLDGLLDRTVIMPIANIFRRNLQSN
jgi:hypothetical protein